jgi:hypothetical protein
MFEQQQIIQANMHLKVDTKNQSFRSTLLHSDILKYFEYNGMYELCDIKTHEEYYKVALKEKAHRPFANEELDLDFVGYLSIISVQDIPIRGKSIVLSLSLKGWCSKTHRKNLIISKYPFLTEDLIFTKRLFEKYNSSK